MVQPCRAVIVQGRGLEITESIREYAEKKIEKAVSHFDQHDVREVDVRCSSRGGEKQLGGSLQKTEVTAGLGTFHHVIFCNLTPESERTTQPLQ